MRTAVDPTDLWFDHTKIPRHFIDVGLEFGELSKVVDWCEQTCIGTYRFTTLRDADDTHLGYRFFFKSKKDLLLFAITWK